MNESVRESTKEKGDLGRLYAVTISNLDEDVMYTYIFESAMIWVECSERWKYYDREPTKISLKNSDCEKTILEKLQQSHVTILYVDEEVVCVDDVLAKTI